MTQHYRQTLPPPYDRGTYPISVSAAEAAAGTVLHYAKMRLMGWSLASVGVDTLQNHGEVTSPAAGAVIAQINAVPIGDYIASWIVELAGTLAAGDQDNFNLVNGGTTVLASVNDPVEGEYEQLSVVITRVTSGSVSVKANAAGTVGAIYSAQLVLTPLAAGAIGQLMDAGQVVGLVSTGADQLDTQWFGEDGVYVGTSIAVQSVNGSLAGVVYVCDEPADLTEVEPSQLSSSRHRR